MLLFLNVDHYFIFYFTAVDNFIFFLMLPVRLPGLCYKWLYIICEPQTMGFCLRLGDGEETLNKTGSSTHHSQIGLWSSMCRGETERVYSKWKPFFLRCFFKKYWGATPNRYGSLHMWENYTHGATPILGMETIGVEPKPETAWLLQIHF